MSKQDEELVSLSATNALEEFNAARTTLSEAEQKLKSSLVEVNSKISELEEIKKQILSVLDGSSDSVETPLETVNKPEATRRAKPVETSSKEPKKPDKTDDSKEDKSKSTSKDETDEWDDLLDGIDLDDNDDVDEIQF